MSVMQIPDDNPGPLSLFYLTGVASYEGDPNSQKICVSEKSVM